MAGTSYDLDQIEFPDGTIHNLRDSRVDNLAAGDVSYSRTTSGLAADDVQEAIDEVVSDIKGTTIDEVLFHLGFYLDENGGLCQVNSI